jgi:hypothetical protein
MNRRTYFIVTVRDYSSLFNLRTDADPLKNLGFLEQYRPYRYLIQKRLFRIDKTDEGN